MIKFNGKKYDNQHGKPFDRGSADSYYHRAEDPHWWPDGTYNGTRVEASEMSKAEIEAYHAGFSWNESMNNFKEW